MCVCVCVCVCMYLKTHQYMQLSCRNCSKPDALGNVYLTNQTYSTADLCKRMELSIKKGIPLKPSRNY